MVEKDLLAGYISAMRSFCKPQMVKIRMRCIRNNFYITFNGDALKDENYWEEYWDGFEKVVIYLLRKYEIKYKQTKTKNCRSVVLIGTLLDILKDTKDNESV